MNQQASEISQEYINAFIVKGKKAEKQFSELFKNIKESSFEDDKYKHIDLIIETKVDVKGIKKIYRTDQHPDENYHWIEIKNNYGYDGWAFTGDSEFIAFQTKRYFVIVHKEKLKNWIAKNVIKEYVNEPELYKLYIRKDQKGLLTLVKTLDLCFISDKIIEYKTEE